MYALIVLSMLFNPVESDAVNAVLGDAGFVARYGRAPTQLDSETLRIQAHLELVERRLRSTPPRGLTVAQRNARTRLLDVLSDYAAMGVFPQNERPGERRPHFVDAQGRRCAVAHLIETSGASRLLSAIQAAHEWDYVADMTVDGLDSWARTHGFAASELAAIQPTYGPERTEGLTVYAPRTARTLDLFWDGPGEAPRVRRAAQHALDRCVTQGVAAVVASVQIPRSTRTGPVGVQTNVQVAAGVGRELRPTKAQLECMHRSFHEYAQRRLAFFQAGPQIAARWTHFASTPALFPRVGPFASLRHASFLWREIDLDACGSVPPTTEMTFRVFVAESNTIRTTFEVLAEDTSRIASIPEAFLRCAETVAQARVGEVMMRMEPGPAIVMKGSACLPITGRQQLCP